MHSRLILNYDGAGGTSSSPTFNTLLGPAPLRAFQTHRSSAPSSASTSDPSQLLQSCSDAFVPIVSTTRPLTFPVLRRSKTSLIDSRGCVSIIALTLPSAAKLRASAKSSRVPTIEPRMGIAVQHQVKD